MIRLFALGALLALAACQDPPETANAAAARADAPRVIAGERTRPAPPLTRRVVKVRLVTEMGDIVLALDGRRAPVTASNFLRYVDSGRLDNTVFYRAARTRGAPERGFIQGGIDRAYRRMFSPIVHEPTNQTGILHEAGTISMAKTSVGPAIGEFFIISDRMPYLDARDDHDGYAAFGRVIEGMDTVRRILASPVIPNAGRGGLRNQMIADPVRVIRAERVDTPPAEPRHAGAAPRQAP